MRVAIIFLLFFSLTCVSNASAFFAGKPDTNDRFSSGDLISKVKEAQLKLRGESVQIIKDVVGTKRVRVGRRKYKSVPVIGVVGREMAIAVMDSDGGIRIARAIKSDNSLEVLTPGIILSLRRSNGINSNIASIKPAGGKVLAVKYPINNERNRFGAGNPVIEVVYTPYSPEICNREIIERGIDVHNGIINSAYAYLKKLNVFSLAFPGRKVVDVIPKDVVTVLLMNEHVDPGAFKTPGLAAPLVEEVLMIIAMNGESAYMYSISPAGARGLVQMIPSTYSLISKKYPGARLNSNFAEGMGDSVNAVVAQVLLCDSDWQAIRSRKAVGAKSIGPYLAAAYNGGVGRVISFLEHGEAGWVEDPDPDRQPMKIVKRRVPVKYKTSRGRTRTKYIVKNYEQPIFKSETSKYIRQYHWIYDYFVSRKVKGFKVK